MFLMVIVIHFFCLRKISLSIMNNISFLEEAERAMHEKLFNVLLVQDEKIKENQINTQQLKALIKL